MPALVSLAVAGQVEPVEPHHRLGHKSFADPAQNRLAVAGPDDAGLSYVDCHEAHLVGDPSHPRLPQSCLAAAARRRRRALRSR